VVVDFVVVVDAFDAGGLAAVEVVAGVVGVVGPVRVLAAVVVEATLADPALEPSPQPAIATTHRHAATPANDIGRDLPPKPDGSCSPNPDGIRPPNLRPMITLLPEILLIFRRSALYKSGDPFAQVGGELQPTSAGSSTSVSSTSPINRRASRGSIRPAPRRAVDSAPQATPKRRHWSGARDS